MLNFINKFIDCNLLILTILQFQVILYPVDPKNLLTTELSIGKLRRQAF